jgi:hypothetical protein
MKIGRLGFAGVLFGQVLLVSACGPTPVAQTQPQKQVAQDEQPVAEKQPQKEVQLQPAAVKPTPAAKERTPRAAPLAANGSVSTPASSATSPSAGSLASSTASGTLTLPVPLDPPIIPPVPPSTDVKDVPEPAPAPAPRQIHIPSGTLVSVRMIDSVDSSTGHAGETFKASLDRPVTVDSETVFPRGAEVYVKLSKVESAGRVRGQSELQLQLDRIFLGSKSYIVESNTFTSTGASQSSRTAKTAGLGAAIGAAIGAISGGGKGAVLGGATGAGAGVGVEAVRKGDQVRVDSETRLEFRLEEALDVTVQSLSPNNQPRINPSGPPRFGTRQQ